MDQRFFRFHRVHQVDDGLLRLYCLALRGSLLSVLLRKVPADHAATDRVVPRVMPSDPAYHSALEAACGVRRSHRCNAKVSAAMCMSSEQISSRLLLRSG